MKIFLDTANLDTIRMYNDMGLVDGITTNPSLLAKEGGDCLLYTSPSPRDRQKSRMPSSA